MITCIINGMAAYPAASQSIKITYANQYVTDDGEYSYDITFPMSIMNNRRIFENVSRFDVSKNTKKYDDCKLYVSGRLVLSGVGTIISVTESDIKLQIVGGKSRIKFNSKLESHFIDEMNLGEAVAPGIKKYYKEGWNKFGLTILNNSYHVNMTNLANHIVGVKGKYTFVPVWDETNDCAANFYYPTTSNSMTALYKAAVQPNLIYILHRVLELEGYKIIKDEYDVYPWNTLYIVSAFKTLQFSKCLPHWSAYTFIEEFRKLFNASIVFDEIKKEVGIYQSSEILSSAAVMYEAIDEYSVDYDEDGSLSTTETSNLEYNLGDSANRKEYEVISQKVLKSFKIVELAPEADVTGWTRRWSDKEKRTTIIKQDGVYKIYMNDNGKESWVKCGFWSPLVRDKDSDSSITINISPAAEIISRVRVGEIIKMSTSFRDSIDRDRPFLSVTNDKEASAEASKEDENGEEYYSVQDAIDSESVLDEQESESECMSVFFYVGFYNDQSANDLDLYSRFLWPTFVTDHNINSNYHISKDMNEDDLTLSLCAGGRYSIHKLQNTKTIDTRNCIEIKFRANGIPDPSNIYIFRNKKYICEKIETEIKDDSIDPVHVGYFYMMA